MEITRETPVAMMTAGQLADFLQSCLGSMMLASDPSTRVAGRRYVYGLKGIEQLFHVSNVTAQRYKKGIIRDAVSQSGRKIVVDVEKAMKLFNAAKNLEPVEENKRTDCSLNAIANA